MRRMFGMVGGALLFVMFAETVCPAVEFVEVNEVGRIHSFGKNVINVVTDQNKQLIANLD